jgi:hypothetical protein
MAPVKSPVKPEKINYPMIVHFDETVFSNGII